MKALKVSETFRAFFLFNMSLRGVFGLAEAVS